MYNSTRILLAVLLLLLLAACNGDSTNEQDGDAESVAAAITATTLPPTETPIPPTATPEPTMTPVPPTETPLPTSTPMPTETPLPTETPIPVVDVAVEVRAGLDDVAVEGAELALSSADFEADAVTDADGMATFASVPIADGPYVLAISAESFLPYSDTVTVTDDLGLVTSTLAYDLSLEIVVSSINLRSGPGTNYSVVQSAELGDTFNIIGRNQSGSWYQVELPDDAAAWVSSSADYVSAPEQAALVDVADAPPPPVAVDDDNSSAGGSGGDDTSGDSGDDSSAGDDEGDSAEDDFVTLFYVSNPADVLGTFPLQPFDANTMYNQMLYIRSNLETMRGVLDAAKNGDAAACATYVNSYNNILYTTPFFDDVPDGWAEADFIYTLSFIYALDRTRPAYLSCQNAGTVDAFNYSLAYESINQTLTLLNPTIDGVGGRLGR